MKIASLILVSTIIAQDVPPPPRPADASSSIDITAKSLQEKLNSIGRVSWIEIIRNTTTDEATGPMEAWEEVSRVTINPHTCDMRVDWKASNRDSGGTFFLEELESTGVLTSEQQANRTHPGVHYLMSPVPYSVAINLAGADFKVRDQRTANEIAGEIQQLAQQCKVIPRSVAQSGPGLEETLAFIEDKLNQQGSVNWLTTVQNTVAGANGSPIQMTWRVSNVTGDPRSCVVNYHTKVLRSSNQPVEGNGSLSLRRVEKLAVMSLQDENNNTHARQGHPELIESISPVVYTLAVTDIANRIKSFPFGDQDLANRVAKAMLHAVELCGGGKEPF